MAAGRKAEEQCCDLSARVEELNQLLKLREEQLEDKEHQLEKGQLEAAEGVLREEAATAQLHEKDEAMKQVCVELQQKDELVGRLQEESLKLKAEFEQAGVELKRREAQLSAREDEIKDVMGGLTATVPSIHGTNVLDVSVDDKVLMDMSGSNSPTPLKRGIDTPRSRGPSASSTPNRSRLGSIVDELKEAGFNSGFPSPLCGKGVQDQKTLKKLQQEMEKWQSSVHRAIIEEVGGSNSAKVIAVLNKVMDGLKKELVYQGPEEEEEEALDREKAELRKEVEELKMQLHTCREELNRERELVAKEKERLTDVETMEDRVTEMACLLKAANRALIATGQSATSRENSRPSSPQELTGGGEDDELGEWQLDLEGLELIEWNNNLSRKLVQYSKQLKDDLSRMEGGMEGKRGNSWMTSVMSRLEELNTEPDKSRYD